MNKYMRLPWIDALRAMAMLFVVFGHQVQWFNEFFMYTTPIKIPLFFAISGYLFNERNGSQIEFYKKWFRKLVVPFFFLVTIPSLFFSFYYGIDYLFESWRKMVSGESYWFITCLIVAEVIFFYIGKISKSVWSSALLCLFCLLSGLFFCRNQLLGFAKINTALICQIYLMGGLLLKKYEDKWDHIKIGMSLFMLMTYTLLCYLSQYIFDDISFDCNLNQYYNIGYCMLLIFLGCTSCFLLFKRIYFFPKWITYIGKNTYVLYLWAGHSMIIFVVLTKLGVTFPEQSVIFSLVQTAWAILACMFLAYLINKYFPFIMGKSKVN